MYNLELWQNDAPPLTCSISELERLLNFQYLHALVVPKHVEEACKKQYADGAIPPPISTLVCVFRMRSHRGSSPVRQCVFAEIVLVGDFLPKKIFPRTFLLVSTPGTSGKTTSTPSITISMNTRSPTISTEIMSSMPAQAT